MAAHTCDGCGMLHDTPTQVESPDVAIARIQAESAYKIAQLQARAEKHTVEVEAEASVEVAEAQAEAIVEALSEEPEAEQVAEPDEPAPVVIAQDIVPDEPDAPPPAEERKPEDGQPEHHDRRKHSLGFL